MDIKIGFIVAKNLLPYMENLKFLVTEHVQIIYLPYFDTNQIAPIYRKHFRNLDGVIFSGPFSYGVATSALGSLTIPNTYLQKDEGNLYKILLRLACQGKIDFTRIAIDFISEQNNYMGLDKILHPSNFPRTLDLPFPTDAQSYNEHCDAIIKLKKDGLIDTAIIRYSNMLDKLRHNGIEAHYFYPSKEAFVEAVNRISGQIRESYIINNLPVVGIVFLDRAALSGNQPTPKLRDNLMAAITEFNRQNNMSLLISLSELGCDIISSNQGLVKITNNYTTCRLLGYLNLSFDYKVNIGWGIGHSLKEAQDNANDAIGRAIAEGAGYSFIKQDVRAYPVSLIPGTACVNTSTPIEHVIIESIPGVSKENVRKINLLMQFRESKEISCEDLASYLEVTVRSASRILTVLESCGLAEVSYKKQEKLRGRPAKIYHITAPVDGGMQQKDYLVK